MMEEQYRSIYREETYELLAELETSLIELEDMPDDVELIGQVFRSMHTIKGSGAMFGFDNIAAFTHEVETVLDMVRDGKLPVTRDLTDLTLASCDLIRQMVDDNVADGNQEKFLVQAFQNMAASIPQKALNIDFPDETAETDEDEDDISPDTGDTTYRILFRPAPDIFQTGNNPVLILNEIKEMGECQILAYRNGIPGLREIDPELCYIFWEIFLNTSESLNRIRDIFIFVEGQCTLDIQVVSDMDNAGNFHDKRIGEILVARGDVTAENVEQALRDRKRVGEVLVEAGMLDPETLTSALTQQQLIRDADRKRHVVLTARSIRVPAEKLDSLMDLVGELVTVQARLNQRISVHEDAILTAISEEVQRISSELRDHTMNIRMLPVGTTFRKFKRLVHDLSNELGKEIVVVTEGEETELDKTVLEQLNDPLLHIIRNTLDHDIETPEIRIAKGKPRQGMLRLSAEHSGSDVILRISGDGAGINVDAVRARALEKGLVKPDTELSEKAVYDLIFLPGFSTARRISGVSGRGVGMDVVKSRVENLRGTVEIRSRKDEGAEVILKLPLTLAITDGLLVEVGESNFVMPLLSVEECMEMDRETADKARLRKMMRFRDTLVSYIDLRTVFKIEGDRPALEKTVIVDAGGQRVGFGVDRVIGQYQTVVKNMGRYYKNVRYVSGATIMGNGTVALILDMNRIVWGLQEQISEKEGV